MVKTDVIVIGAGLAGLVAATELAEVGKRVVIVDQEPRQNLGGQAFWSLGGLFLVDSPEQRRLGIQRCLRLAWQDWLGAAGFDRDEDHWPKPLGRGVCQLLPPVRNGAGCARMGHRFFPVVGWAERGGGNATRAWQFRAAFSPHLGDGPGRDRRLSCGGRSRRSSAG